jgi:maltooligosyltrehalose synthase
VIDIDQEMIEKGRAAQALLDSLAWSDTLDELRATWTQELISTAAHEAKRREDLYSKVRVLDEINATLQMRVEIMRQAIERNEEKE